MSGTEQMGPPLGLVVDDFAPVLLKRTIQLAWLSTSMPHRDTLMNLADHLSDCLWSQRLETGRAAGLWGDESGPNAPGAPQTAHAYRPTERFVEVLVAAASLYAGDLAPSPKLVESATDMLRAANHLLAQVTLRRATCAPAIDSELQLIGTGLDRARDRVARHPAVAIALASEALRRLDGLNAARDQASRGMV